MRRFLLILLMCSYCYGFNPTITSFNTGQVSPLLEARVDFQKYSSSSRTLENMLVSVQGPVFRRPGTKYIAAQTVSGAAGRLISYEHSVDDSYILLFENEVMSFFRDGGQILDGVGTETLTGGDKPGTANLVAHWLLNETEGTNVVNDNAAGTYDGTASTSIGTLASDGKVGTGSFDLDATYLVTVSDNDAFSFDDSGDKHFSLVCWAYVVDTGELQVLMSKWKIDTAREWRLSLNHDRKLQMHLCDESISLTSVVSQWKLNDDEAASDAVVDAQSTRDGVATDNTGTFNDTGKIDGALNFGIDNDQVDIADHADHSFGIGTADSAFSVAAWIYVTDQTTAQVIVAKSEAHLDSSEWRLAVLPDEKFSFKLFDNDAGAYIDTKSTAALTTGWHFVVGTYDATEAASGMDLYVDGDLVASDDNDSGTYEAMENLVQDVSIGAYGGGDSGFLDKIDNVMIFNAELTATEISGLYNDGAGTENIDIGFPNVIADDAVGIGWHFFAMTYENSHASWSGATAATYIKLYIDGSLVDSAASDEDDYVAMENTATDVKIGSHLLATGTSTDIWADKIDEISIFKEVLTPTEIASLYSTTSYEIETPYLTGDLSDLNFIKSEDVMYIVHPDHEPRQLSREDHALWSLDALNIGSGPFQAENVDTDLTIKPSAATGTITLTASSNLFRSGHIGSIWRIEQIRDTSQVTGTFTGNGTSIDTPFFSGAYGFTTENNSDGTITLQRSVNGGSSWHAALTALTNADFDNPAEIEEDGAIYRMVMSNFGSPGTNPTYTFTITDNLNKGVVRITGVQNSTIATATVVTALVDNTATSNWREGYWSDLRGWPETVAIHQQRLVFGGSTNFPQTIWFGKTDPDDYTNFTEGTLDTSAFTMALAGNNPIQWLLSQDYLLIGTSGSCGKYGAQGEPVTPTSPFYQEQTKQGSASFRAIFAGDATLYVERGARRIREFIFDLQADKYLSPDLSVLSPEITFSGIKDIAYQFRPSPILWCVLNNGEIATLTFQKDQSVIAWTKQITDGDFESIAIIPNTTEDEVWVTVERTIDGTTETVVRYVEQFQPQDWGSDDNDAWFVDSGISYTGEDANTFTGADHLEGETVSIYADLLIESTETVGAGDWPTGGFTIDNDAARVLVGLPYTSKLETLPIVIDPQDRAANKKVSRVWFDLYKSGAMKYGNGADSDLTTHQYFQNSLILDESATAQDGFYTSTTRPLDSRWVYGSTKKQTIYIESAQPMPLTVRAITLAYKMYGN